MLRSALQDNAGQVEILVSLDSLDPPVGRLRVTSGPGSAPGHLGNEDFCFTGWLGLLRALNEVTGMPAGPSPEEP